MNLIGKMLDNRYEILEKIGVGGMATVYKAKCHVLNRYVAIKILKDEFTTDSDFIKKFNTEAQSAASLAHPNIVSIFDVGNEDNLYYIVMELIQGKTLKEIIVEDGKFSWKWSVNIAIQIASALEIAHKNNIVHRDIKPHNIIITEDGIAKVTDFGIAKAVSNSTITAFGTTIGSVHYFSPEHARGGYTDAKSDLYSLGVVMYEMLTGRVPFDADTPVSVALKQVQEEPVDPITYNKEIPVSVNRIILKAMQKDPNLRYQSATDMIKDLSLALKRPNDDFVVLTLRNEDSPTQKIPAIYELEMQKRNDKNAPKIDENVEEKKTGKFAKIKEFYSKHPFLKVLTILGMLGLVFIMTACIVVSLINGSRPEQKYIPQVAFSEEQKMITEEEAIKLLEEAGFENVKIERESSETVAAGYVISQSPNKYNFLYNLDQEVILTVSSGPEIVTLPTQIVGEKIDDIKKQLDTLGLKYNITEETSETVEKGVILDTQPAAGEEITKSTVIELKVSSGSQFKDVQMINVLGEKEEDAKAKLTVMNLKVEVSYDENPSKDDGVVLSQTVPEGKTIKEQDTVKIVVNRLPKESNVTFNINVASYVAPSAPNDDEEQATKNVSVEIYVANISVKKVSVSSDTEKYSFSYKTAGTKQVQIIVDGNEVYNQRVDFSNGDQSITVSK